MASGVQWASKSVEFRLLALHQAHGEQQNKGLASLLSELLEGIFFSVATGKLTDESRDKILSSLRRRVMTLLFPELVQEADEAKISERQRAAGLADMVQLLGQKGSFSSIEQLQGALTALKQSLAERSG